MSPANNPIPTTVVQTRHGEMRVIDSDQWISRSLRELGEFSEDEIIFMRLVIQTLSTKSSKALEIIDAGAYIGDTSLALSPYVDKIWAFEPQEDIRNILLENLERNHITNVEVLPYALGPYEGDLRYDSRPMDIHSYGGNQMANDGDASCKMVTLDSLNLRPSFIKADIEGMEGPMLMGARETLFQTRCPLFMEYDTVMLPEDCPQLPQILVNLGYTIFPQAYFIYRANNFNKNPVNNFDVTVSKMLYALPPIPR